MTSSAISEASSPSSGDAPAEGRTRVLSALGIFLVLTLGAAWAYNGREDLDRAPIALAVLPMALLMAASATIVLVAVHTAFSPAFRGLRLALRDPVALAVAFLAVALYVTAFLFSQDTIQSVAMGPLFQVIREGVPGFTPILIFFPVKGTGVVLASYQLAVLVSLGLLLALNAVALTRLVRMRARLPLFGSGGLGAGGAGLGLLVWCPTCIAPPTIAFISTYLLPVLSFTPVTQSIMVGTIFLLSMLLLLIALDASARALSGQACRVNGAEL